MQPLQQQQHSSTIRYKMASDARLSDRQVVQSEPARPKPNWSDDDGINKDAANTEDDDGFEDIFQ